MFILSISSGAGNSTQGTTEEWGKQPRIQHCQWYLQHCTLWELCGAWHALQGCACPFSGPPKVFPAVRDGEAASGEGDAEDAAGLAAAAGTGGKTWAQPWHIPSTAWLGSGRQVGRAGFPKARQPRWIYLQARSLALLLQFLQNIWCVRITPFPEIPANSQHSRVRYF